MESLRALLLGTVLLILHSSSDASALTEMFIDNSPTDISEEEVKTEHALVPVEDDREVTDVLDIDLQPADFRLEEIPSDDIEQTTENDLNERDVEHWWRNKKIAFSAYLSADRTLGRNQHVKFDRVLLNDGNGYEASTGVFRAPVSGVYSFTFVVAQRHRYEIRLNLVVDGKVVVGAIAEGTKYYHDVQGTNTANVHVRKGRPVWVQSYCHGRIEGSHYNFRYTSFSGHILYQRR